MNSDRQLAITFVSHDAGRAGAQRLLLTLIRWLRDNRGIRPATILRRSGPLVADFRELGPVFEVEPLLEKSWDEVASGILDFSRNAEMIYINTLVPGDIGEVLSALKVPTVTHAHEMEHAIRRWCAPEHLAALINVTNHYITASPPVAEILQRSYGVDPKRMNTIYEFIRCSETDLGSWSKAEVRRKQQLPEDGFLVFGCGTMDWRKGPDLFVEVAREAIQEFNIPNCYFFWIGGAASETEEQELHARINATGLTDQVRFLGEVTDPSSYFAAGDVFVLTSREDPYPLVCLEAADRGLPIVCFDQIGGIPEFVRNDAGYVVPFGNTHAMAEKISLLHESPKESRRRGAAAYLRVRSQHDVCVAGEQIMGIILSVLLKHDRRALLESNVRVKRLEAEQSALVQREAELEATVAAHRLSLEHNEAEFVLLRTEKDGFASKVSALESAQGALEKRITEFEATVAASEQRLREKDACIAALESETDLLDQKLAETASALSVAEANIIERNRKIDALEMAQSGILWSLLSGYRRAKDRCFPVGSKQRRFYDGCLRLVKPQHLSPNFQNGKVIDSATTFSSAAADILYSIDSLALRAGRLYGWGWLLHKTRPVSSLRVVARTKKHTYPVPCQYGVRRDDVGRTQELNGAQNSGFLILSRLPQEKLIELFLEVELEGGEICRIDCHDFETIVQRSQLDEPCLVNAGRLKGVRRIARFGRRGIAYMARGDWKGLHNKIEKTLERSRELGNSLPVFSSQEFLGQLGSSKDKEFVLLIDHNLGGGANQYRTKVISKSLENDRPVLLLFYNLWRLHYSIRYLDQGRDLVFDVESLDSIFSLTKSLHVKEIFLNNTVSFDDPLTFATLLPQLKKASGAELTIALHDYFALCPSWNLLDDSGHSCGVPSMDRCRQCLPNLRNALSFWVDVKTIDQWRELWSGCLEEATQILCFSRSSIELLRRAYPALDAGKIKHQPHTLEDFPRKKIQSHIGSRLNIGIVGEITMPKGAGIVVEMARLIVDRQLPVKITVIGSIEGLVKSDAVSITGPYVRQNLPGIIEKVRPNVFFVPSIWPETFSYVTAELMEMGVPVAVFNLGAQGERVAAYPRGLVIHEIDSENALDRLIAFHAKLRESESPSSDDGRFA